MLRAGLRRLSRCFVITKFEIDGFNLERHLVGCREKRLVGGVESDELVGPGIESQEAGERHGGLLFEIGHVELGSLGHESGQPEGLILIALGETVSDQGFVERFERLDALLQLLEVKTEVLLTVGEFFGAEQFQCFLGGRGVVGVRVVHGDAVEDRIGGEEQAIVEGVLGIEAVRQDDVGDLEGEDGVEVAHLLRTVLRQDSGGVNEALGDDDGVADGHRLERHGEQSANPDRSREGDVVVSEDIAGEGFEGLVEVAGGVEEPGLEEALNDVVLSLLNPGALGAEWAYVLRVVTDVGGADDIHGGVGRLRRRNLEDIAPDVIDGLECEGSGDALGVAFLNIERGRKPEIGLDVRAPAIEVIELFDVFFTAREVTVEADDVAVAGFRPRCGRRSDRTHACRRWVLRRRRRWECCRGSRCGRSRRCSALCQSRWSP